MRDDTGPFTAPRPVVYAGGGAVISEASDALRPFVRKTKIPITTTLMAKGVFPEDDDLHLGMLGMHGTKYASRAIYESSTSRAFFNRAVTR